MAKAKVATAKEIDLNRWCIEQAMRWPTVSVGYGNHGSFGGLPKMETDVDVIGRANKIMVWIKQAH